MPLTVELKNFDYGGKTDKGLIRTNNEDFFGYFDTINGHVFVVCDGMGGHNAGEVAASMAVASIKHFFLTYLNKDIKKGLKEAIEFANNKIIEKAAENSSLNKMGTTICIVIIVGSKIYYAHLGDSRIYIMRRGILEQLTSDHSYIQNLINKGELSEEQAKNHPRRNEITKALGLSAKTNPTICRKPIIANPTDILLICSDGLNAMLDNEQIKEILKEENNSSQNIANELIETANKNGGVDNVTVQIIKFHSFALKNESAKDDKLEIVTKSKKLNNYFKNSILTIFVILLVIFGNYYFNKIIKEKYSKIAKNLKHESNSVSVIINIENKNLVSKDFNNFDSNIKFIRLAIKDKHKIEIYDEYALLEKKYGVSINNIKTANNINYNYFIIGKEIIIPLEKID